MCTIYEQHGDFVDNGKEARTANTANGIGFCLQALVARRADQQT
jgi:hypothetical protein